MNAHSPCSSGAPPIHCPSTAHPLPIHFISTVYSPVHCQCTVYSLVAYLLFNPSILLYWLLPFLLSYSLLRFPPLIHSSYSILLFTHQSRSWGCTGSEFIPTRSSYSLTPIHSSMHSLLFTSSYSFLLHSLILTPPSSVLLFPTQSLLTTHHCSHAHRCSSLLITAHHCYHCPSLSL
jgi:hypothetical protein